jgi:hypothetical protein
VVERKHGHQRESAYIDSRSQREALHVLRRRPGYGRNIPEARCMLEHHERQYIQSMDREWTLPARRPGGSECPDTSSGSCASHVISISKHANRNMHYKVPVIRGHC